MLHARGVFALFSAHQRQVGSFRPHRKAGRKGGPTSRFVRRLGTGDQLVAWRRPELRPRWMTAEQHDALPDELPDDLDYERYLKVTREILMDIGFDHRPPPPPKLVRMTKANTIPILHLWALVA